MQNVKQVPKILLGILASVLLLSSVSALASTPQYLSFALSENKTHYDSKGTYWWLNGNWRFYGDITSSTAKHKDIEDTHVDFTFKKQKSWAPDEYIGGFTVTGVTTRSTSQVKCTNDPYYAIVDADYYSVKEATGLTYYAD